MTFHWNTAVTAIEGGLVATSRGPLTTQACIVCPGDDFSTLFPERIAPFNLRVCTLQMLRVTPTQPTRFGAAVMSNLSYGRYEGFADLPEAQVLLTHLDAEQTEMRETAST